MSESASDAMPLARWRLVLGALADQRLPALDDKAVRIDRVLDYLYGREVEGRGVMPAPGAAPSEGTLDGAQLTLVDWLGEVRELFPQEVQARIEGHALERYGLVGLVSDPQVLQRLQPSMALLKTLLTLRGHLGTGVLPVARQVIARVVAQIRLPLEAKVRSLLAGRLNRQRHSPLALARNFDALGTLRQNLKHYQPERRRLVVEQLRFFERNSRRLPWQVILCLDQSASMAEALIHGAVMAGILAALPALQVKLVVFDTRVVDLSGLVGDPVELLLRVQLGGGTDIGQALRYCSRLVDNPQRSVLVLVSDFCEGAAPAELLRVVRQLAEARVRLLGLAALDERSEPVYDRGIAERLAECGMQIAVLTPMRLAQWLQQVVS